jgi:hypothetical protein
MEAVDSGLLSLPEYEDISDGMSAMSYLSKVEDVCRLRKASRGHFGLRPTIYSSAELTVRDLKKKKTAAWKAYTSCVPESQEFRRRFEIFKSLRHDFAAAVRSANDSAQQQLWKECLLNRSRSPKQYWREIGYGVLPDAKNSAFEMIDLSLFFDHFSNLAKAVVSVPTVPHAPDPVLSRNEILDGPICEFEVKEVIQELSGMTSSGGYPISSQDFKWMASNYMFLNMLLCVLNYVYQTGTMPASWMVGTLCPIPKPNKDPLPSNCRPLAVAILIQRILSSIVARRLESWASLNDDQAGFRRHRSIVDQIFILTAVCERAVFNGQQVFLAFIDYSSAFDTVSHSKLWEILKKRGISPVTLQYLQNLYNGATNKIKWQGKLSEPYRLEKGVRQGDPCSGILFNIYLDALTEAVAAGRASLIMIEELGLFLLKFADDIVLFAYSVSELQLSLDRLTDFSLAHELVVNVKKSFSMVVKGLKRSEFLVNVAVNGSVLEQVSEFRYLGYHINECLNTTRSRKYQTRSLTSSFFVFLQKLANLPPGYPFRVAEHMFEATVASTASFCTEITGANTVANDLQFQFWKRCFGLRRSTPHDALYHLIGQGPQTHRHLFLQFKYFVRALRRKSGLVYGAAVTFIENSKLRKRSWFKSAMLPWATVIHLDWARDHKWWITTLTRDEPQKFLDLLRQRFWHDVSQRIQVNSLDKGRLSFLSLFKVPTPPSRAEFLDILPRHQAAVIMKSLSSGHHFRIETGRWNKTDKTLRTCNHCGSIEDENHVLFECFLYYDLREKFFELLGNDCSRVDFSVFFWELIRNRVDWSDEDRRRLICLSNFLRKVLDLSYQVFNGVVVLCRSPTPDLMQDVASLPLRNEVEA